MMFISNKEYNRILERLSDLELRQRVTIDKRDDIYATRDLDNLRRQISSLEERFATLCSHFGCRFEENLEPPKQFILVTKGVKVEPSE